MKQRGDLAKALLVNGRLAVAVADLRLHAPANDEDSIRKWIRSLDERHEAQGLTQEQAPDGDGEAMSKLTMCPYCGIDNGLPWCDGPHRPTAEEWTHLRAMLAGQRLATRSARYDAGVLREQVAALTAERDNERYRHDQMREAVERLEAELHQASAVVEAGNALHDWYQEASESIPNDSSVHALFGGLTFALGAITQPTAAKCTECGSANCQRLWAEQRKCCPDCTCEPTAGAGAGASPSDDSRPIVVGSTWQDPEDVEAARVLVLSVDPLGVAYEWLGEDRERCAHPITARRPESEFRHVFTWISDPEPAVPGEASQLTAVNQAAKL